jgi:hypothetical protein
MRRIGSTVVVVIDTVFASQHALSQRAERDRDVRFSSGLGPQSAVAELTRERTWYAVSPLTAFMARDLNKMSSLFGEEGAAGRGGMTMANARSCSSQELSSTLLARRR